MGHPTLREAASPFPIEEIGSQRFDDLVGDLKDTLAATGNGIGLAAPQINASFRVAVIDIPNPVTRYGPVTPMPFTVYVNPTISVVNEDAGGYWEGCLSVPNMMGYVERAQHIKVEYLNEQAQPQSIELKGFLATVFQHEFDHLDGILYVDRLKDTRLFSFDTEYAAYHLPRDLPQDLSSRDD
jgi:peptide deformylase